MIRSTVAVIASLASLPAIAAMREPENSMAGTTASTTVNATALLIAPIMLRQTRELDFGSHILMDRGGTDGRVDLTAASSSISTSGVFPVDSPQFGEFEVEGEPNANFTITPSQGNTLTNEDGPGTITFATNTTGSGTLDNLGAATILVGGRIRIDRNQNPGTYSGDYSVIVTYDFSQ